MGSPKSLLEYRGETFLDRLIGLFQARCSPVIVTLGARAEEVRRRAARAAVFVVNPDYANGQTTSMQCGLRALPEEAGSVLFTLVDHPAVSEETLDALLGMAGAPRLSGMPRAAGLQPPVPPGEERPLLRVPRYRQPRASHLVCAGTGP